MRQKVDQLESESNALADRLIQGQVDKAEVGGIIDIYIYVTLYIYIYIIYPIYDVRWTKRRL